MLPIIPLMAVFLAFMLLPLVQYERARLLLHTSNLVRARLAYDAEREAFTHEQTSKRLMKI